MRNVSAICVMYNSIQLIPLFTLKESMESKGQNNFITYKNIQKRDRVNYKHTIH